MFKVNISNSSQNLSWSGSFNTEIEAQGWLASQIGKPHRLPERIVSITDEYDQDDVLEVIQSEVQVGVDENEQPIMEMQDTHVRLRSQFTSEIIDITAEHNLAQQKQEAQAYLNSTDWYIIRNAERGVAVPEEVTQARLAAIATLNL